MIEDQALRHASQAFGFFSLGACGTRVCRPVFDDDGAELAAATKGANRVTTEPLTVTPLDP